jgi:DNA-binding response OmpR family regulator
LENNKKVLVIDDDAKITRVLDLKLRKAGYQVIVAANGEAGLNLFKAQQPDMVITDILMPGKEGLETIMELRRDFPEVKIIAISGGGRVGAGECLDLAKKFGAQHTFSKPFTGNEILQAVRELLDNSPGAKNTPG